MMKALCLVLALHLCVTAVSGQAAGAACGEGDACDANLKCDSDMKCKNKVGGTCVAGDTAFCPVNAKCTGTTGAQTCTCTTPYAAASDLCAPAAGKVGGSCTPSCTANASCKENKCDCDDGYVTKTSDLTCEAGASGVVASLGLLLAAFLVASRLL